MQRVILFLLFSVSVLRAEPDPKDVYHLCNPSNYSSSETYWQMLLEYGLVNTNDQLAYDIIWQDSDFASRVQLSMQQVNLFDGKEHELVLKLNFDNQSYYVHVYYAGTENAWYKTTYKIDFHMPVKSSGANRWIDIQYKELFQQGEYVLWVEKSQQYENSDAVQSWLSIWKAEQADLQMVYTRKMNTRSSTDKLTTVVKNDLRSAFPKTIVFQVSEEKLMDEEEEDEKEKWTLKSYTESCWFESVKSIHCRVFGEQTQMIER